MPLVSIIVALHNKGLYVEETIQMVLAQTMPDWELIVVENGSTDDGPDIVRQFKDPRIQLHISPKNGPGVARNFGLRLAVGKWILFLDADDLIEPEYLDSRLSSLVQMPEAKIVAGPWKEFTDKDHGTMSLCFPSGWDGRLNPEDSAFCFTPWILHAAITRRDHIFERKCWDETLDHLPAEDCGFWFRMVVDTKLAWSQNNGALYRKNTSNSRDAIRENLENTFSACRGNIRANEQYLVSLKKSPNDVQISTAVRVLRRLLTQCGENKKVAELVRQEIHYWLKRTPIRDVKMLYWRFFFREFSFLRKQYLPQVSP